MKWTLEFKAEMAGVALIFAVFLGWQLWSDYQKQQFNWWTIPLAVIAVAAAVLFTRLFWKIVRS
ncbi:MAG: hypothetical protein AAB513_00045 [Patescibacteria group bacterium]